MQTWTWQENAERLKLNAKTMSDVFNTETTVYVAIRIKKLKMEDITDTDDTYAKRNCKDFEIKNLGEHHDLCVQCDTLLVVDV